MAEKITPARLAYLTGNAYDDGRRDCRLASGDRSARIARHIAHTETAPAYDPWRSRSYPEHAAALTAAYDRGWRDGERDLCQPDPGWS